MRRGKAICGWIGLLAAGVCAAEPLFTMPPEKGSREARFQNPPPSSRILPIRHVPSDDLKRQAAELKRAKTS